MADAPLTRSAFLRPAILAIWSRGQLAQWASRAAASGITAAITKLEVIAPELRAVLADHGITTVGAFACYSDHARQAPLPGTVRPVGADGRLLSGIEWYRGIVPGNDEYDDALVDRLRAEAERAEVGTILLDFARWPGHWELESRADGHPRAASFDPQTMARFADRIGRSALTPHDILTEHRSEWADFRVDIISAITARLAREIRAAGAEPGVFLVPVRHRQRRADYGQDAVELAGSVSVFAIMAYQQMLALSSADVLAMADEVTSTTDARVIAMTQITADPAYAGRWDWGPPIDADELTAHLAVLDAATREGRLHGLSYFPGEAPLPRTDFDAMPRLEGTLR
ncbi:hypothetical protein [Microbacterium sulfonylureivorans]|uniref:hypothetical protein n=1 Tax=Microbacterium sulfonylureivorans TaxID=2486854 RepID=UPI000FDC1A15|nr:hypothetical protein [Microbacterium sulfonylureivorans]